MRAIFRGSASAQTPRRDGFSLIDTLVGIALVLILFLALFGVLRASLALSNLARIKSAEVGLLETQMEYLRGISYDSLGITDGDPVGVIAAETEATVDGAHYTIRTAIVMATSTDPAKTAEVTVSTNDGAHALSLVSNFAP